MPTKLLDTSTPPQTDVSHPDRQMTTLNRILLSLIILVILWSLFSIFFLTEIFNLITIVILFAILVFFILQIRRGKSARIESRLSEQNAINASHITEQQLDLRQGSFSSDLNQSLLQAIEGMTVLSKQSGSEIEFMNQASQLLVEKFQFDYIGIYLLDEMKEKLVLHTEKKSNWLQSPSYRQDLKVTISPLNPAAYESDNIKFLEKGKAIYVSQPTSLPEMERNLSYPLAFEGVIMGLVNIQSKSLVSGTDDELVWKIITGLISISLKMKQSVGGVEKQPRDEEPLSGAQLHSGWRQLSQAGPIGFLYDRIHTIPYRGLLPQDVRNTLLNKKSATYRVNEGSPSSRLIAPILIKANVIGTIGYDDPDPEHVWLPSEISFLETIASRVSLALENSRLVAEAENRAESERIVGQITSRIRETLNIDTIIQTALQEFQQSFGLTEAEIRLQAPRSESEKN